MLGTDHHSRDDYFSDLQIFRCLRGWLVVVVRLVVVVVCSSVQKLVEP